MVSIYGPYNVTFTEEFQEGMTVAQLVQKIKDNNQLRFNGNSYSLQETITGKVLSPSDLIMDERRYYLSAWLQAVSKLP